jgi:hypothetical protein
LISIIAAREWLLPKRDERLMAVTFALAERKPRLTLTPSPSAEARAWKPASLVARTRLSARPKRVSDRESLTLFARPPKRPLLCARLSLVATPNSLKAIELDRLFARPKKAPLARASLLLIATPPNVAAILSLSAIALPPNLAVASAFELLTARPRTAVATARLFAYPFRVPRASLFATARPPWVAPAIASESALPCAVALAVADPPLLAVETAVAEPAMAGDATVSASPVKVASRRFIVVSLFHWGLAWPVYHVLDTPNGRCSQVKYSQGVSEKPSPSGYPENGTIFRFSCE